MHSFYLVKNCVFRKKTNKQNWTEFLRLHAFYLTVAVTSDLIIVGDVDGLVGRHSKHKCFPYPGEFLGTHQAEKGPFGHVHHGALAASVRRGAGGMKNQEYESPFNPKAWRTTRASGRVVGFQRCRRLSAADGSGLNDTHSAWQISVNLTDKFLDIATEVSTRTNTFGSEVKQNCCLQVSCSKCGDLHLIKKNKNKNTLMHSVSQKRSVVDSCGVTVSHIV